MSLKHPRKVAAGSLAGLALVGAIAFSSSASASTQREAQPDTKHTAVSSEIASGGGGAVDLAGNPVESRIYIGETLPADLGKLQYSGTAKAGDGVGNRALREFTLAK